MAELGFGKTIHSIVGKLKKEMAGLILAPSILVLVIALFFGWGLQKAVIAVSVQDTGFEMPGLGHVSIPDQLLSGLDKNIFKVIKVSNTAEAYNLVEQGKASVGLSFPDGLTQEMMIKLDDPSYAMKVKIGLNIDKANPIVSLLTMGQIAGALAKNAQGLNLADLPIPFDLSALLKGGIPNIGAFVMPGLFILLLFIISVIATALLTDMVRSQNPELKSGKANAAFITVFTVAFAVQAVLLFLTGILIFHVSIPGNLALASIPVIIMVFCGASFGTMFSTAFKMSERMGGVVVYAILPIFLCGILFPLEMVPGWLRWLSYILPPFYAVKSFRGFTLYNRAGVAEWALLGVLLLMGIIFLAVSVVLANNSGKNKKEA